MHIFFCLFARESKVCACGFSADVAIRVGESSINDYDVAFLLTDMCTDCYFLIVC